MRKLLVALLALTPAAAYAPPVSELASLMTWALKLTKYEAPADLPGVKVVSAEFFRETYCASHDVPDADCQVAAVYNIDSRTIYVWDQLPSKMQRNVLVHELVHFLQHENLTQLSECAQEYEAHYVQWSYRTIVEGYTGDFRFPTEFYKCPSGFESSPLVVRSSLGL